MPLNWENILVHTVAKNSRTYRTKIATSGTSTKDKNDFHVSSVIGPSPTDGQWRATRESIMESEQKNNVFVERVSATIVTCQRT